MPGRLIRGKMGNDVDGNQGKFMAEAPNPTPDKPKKKVIQDPRGSSGDRQPDKERRGKGKRGREEDRKPATPPALIRGPRPKPKVEPEETPAELGVSDSDQVETDASTEADSVSGDATTEVVADPSQED